MSAVAVFLIAVGCADIVRRLTARQWLPVIAGPLVAAITAALTGKNPLNFQFIRRDHPAINARGELCDRWGTPFFFHALSGTRMELRSAGPDRQMYTDDDLVFTP